MSEKSEKHYPYYGGNFDRIVFDKDGSVWVSEAKLRDVESENASLRGAARGLGRLCDRYKAENDQLKSLTKLDDSTISVLNACMDDLNAENFKLRGLVRDMWHDGMCECDECGAFAKGQYHCAECEYHYPDRMRELGIEVNYE